MTAVMMGCGHAANATRDGEACCAICAGITPGAYVATAAPDTAGRQAKCGCGATRPSSTDLAFFESCGEGSYTATETCGTCRYARNAHEKKNAGERVSARVCGEFVPRGALGADRFYCGCRGWD